MQNTKIVTLDYIFFELLEIAKQAFKSCPFCILKTIKDTMMKLNSNNVNQHETMCRTQKT